MRQNLFYQCVCFNFRRSQPAAVSLCKVLLLRRPQLLLRAARPLPVEAEKPAGATGSAVQRIAETAQANGRAGTDDMLLLNGRDTTALQPERRRKKNALPLVPLL